MPDVLEAELKTYEKHHSELLGKSEGKFVLIHDDAIVGVYESKYDAFQAGYEGFGNVPFLVKQIVKVEAPQNFISNLLAI